MMYSVPIGSESERASGKVWPGRWFDATGYDQLYELGYHTGADLNLNYPHWNADAHSDVYAIGNGRVTYADIYSTQYWGGIIVIDHGIVDQKPLFSRYGHVENIRVSVDQQVGVGDPIAKVGNGEGLFSYHLHFDISQTDRLRHMPGDWPGHSRARVHTDYVNPQEWLQVHIIGDNDGVVIPPVRDWYVVATLGLRVRENHSTSAIQVGSLVFGSKISIEETTTVDQDSYTWGHISGGMYNGDWVAMGTSDQSVSFLSRYPPGS